MDKTSETTEPPAMDPRARKRALRRITNGMYVLTSRRDPGDDEDEPYAAATVTWLSQCSFTPPLVMVGIRRGSAVDEYMRSSRVAAVHVLARDQRDLAQRFFSTTRLEGDRINGEPFVLGVTSVPLLPSVATRLECRVREVVEAPGDHAIFLLEVVAAHEEEAEPPLTVADSPWEYGG